MSAECKFQGPAGSKFPTFGDQSLYSMNNSCPRWNNHKDPKSYMIPPIFYFKHPEMPDYEIEEFRQAGKFDRDVIDRTSDEAERMLFDASKALVDEGSFAPFVAIRDFNLNRISSHLSKIFPGLPSSVTNQKFSEYDYVLIGPKIGIVVIEIKSTPFTGKRDFDPYLPEQYKHGIEQLRSFDNVLDLLEQVTSTSVDRNHVRRILFTPNLKRVRYEEWYINLDESRKNKVSADGIDRWFWEDTQSVFPQLFTKVRRYFDRRWIDAKQASQLLSAKLRSYLRHTSRRLPFSLSVFALYAPILTGLSSVTIMKEKISIDSETLSERQAVLRVSDCIETQDPWSMDPSNRRRMVPTVKFQTVDLLKSIILTPEQSAALRGPSRQLIVGAAGTGKTIILQAKALELLRNGDSVLVLCSELYIGHYEDLFQKHNLNGYAVESWPKLRDSFLTRAVITSFEEFMDAVCTIVHGILMDLTNRIWIHNPCFKPLVGYDHILIDDAYANLEHLTYKSWVFVLYPILMHISHWKTVWVAADPFTDESFYYFATGLEEYDEMHLLYSSVNQAASSGCFGVSNLTKIMRCPENIFQSVWPMCNVAPYPMPVIGHKIQGSRSVKIRSTLASVSKEIIDLINKGNYPLEQIAVIAGETRELHWINALIKELEEQNIPCDIDNRLCLQSDKSDNLGTPQACNNNATRGRLGIYKWNQAHSLEWPLVIYIAPQLRRTSEESHYHKAIRRYLACSRATGMLVEIALYKS